MSVKERSEKQNDLLVTKHWHSYRLQNLSTSRFVKAVGDILDKKNYLVPPNRMNKAQA